MSLHDLFTHAGRDQARRRLRLRRARRGAGLPVLPRRGPGGPLATARGRRRLAVIDRALAAQTPRLASMFAMFNELADEPVSAERLPNRAWPRPGLAQVALFAALAAIVALTVVLSTQPRDMIRPCLTSASATSGVPPAAPSFAAPAAPATGSPAAPATASPAASSFAAPAAPAAPATGSPAASSFASSSASPPASSFASSAASSSAGPTRSWSALAAFVPVRGLSCQAYAAPNK